MAGDRRDTTELPRGSWPRKAVLGQMAEARRPVAWRKSSRSRTFDAVPEDGAAPISRTIERLRPRLLQAARRIVHCNDLAEDAVQEAMLGLWGLPLLPPDPTGWLMRAVVYRSLQLLRSRKRRRRHEERACSCRREQDRAIDVQKSLELGEFAALVGGLLDALPESHRVVFRLRETDQLDYEDIAQTLRIPIGTVRSRLSRTRRAIRKGLEGCEWSPS